MIEAGTAWEFSSHSSQQYTAVMEHTKYNNYIQCVIDPLLITMFYIQNISDQFDLKLFSFVHLHWQT